MTPAEFRTAFIGLCMGIQSTATGKRQHKSLEGASKHFGRGAGAKPRHMKELQNKTLLELYAMAKEMGDIIDNE